MTSREPTRSGQLEASCRSGRHARQEAGFTLIEVMVVVLIIGILLAIGIPTFVGARDRAHDTVALSSLDTAVDAAMIASDLGVDHTKAVPTNLASAEPSLTFLPATQESGGPSEISVDAARADRWVATVKSDSGRCFAVEVTPNGTAPFVSQSCSAALAVDIDTPEEPKVPVNVAPLSAVSHTCCYKADAYPASNLIDGSLTNYNHAAWAGGQSAAFELASKVSIVEIRLWNRGDCCPGRMKNLSIFVSDQPISANLSAAKASGAASFSVPGEVGKPSTVAINFEGRYVRVFNGSTSLHLAEVEIMAVSL